MQCRGIDAPESLMPYGKEAKEEPFEARAGEKLKDFHI